MRLFWVLLFSCRVFFGFSRCFLYGFVFAGVLVGFFIGFFWLSWLFVVGVLVGDFPLGFLQRFVGSCDILLLLD